MGGKRWLVISLVFIGGVFVSGVALGQAPGPQETAQSVMKKVRLLADTKDKDAEARLASEISGYFALQSICEACLGSTWNGLPEAERASFVQLFRDVLEKVAYPKSADFFTVGEVEIFDVSEKKNRAQVDILVEHPDQGEVGVGFTLEKAGDRWVIWDIQLDEVSIRLDLRSKMQKIVKEDGYEELKKKLRDKLNE